MNGVADNGPPLTLPKFEYHPDPIGTGSVEPPDAICRICGRNRGYIYDGPVYGVPKEFDDARICPWCIADGSAHERFEAVFTDIDGVGHGYDEPWEPVPPSVAEEVAYRTPGFSGWQQERWRTHCGDAAEFLGPARYDDLTNAWSEAVDAIRADSGFPPGDAEWDEILRTFDRDYGPTAYVFRCRRCGKLGGYWDCH